jgi:hypothetical protein
VRNLTLLVSTEKAHWSTFSLRHLEDAATGISGGRCRIRTCDPLDVDQVF